MVRYHLARAIQLIEQPELLREPHPGVFLPLDISWKEARQRFVAAVLAHHGGNHAAAAKSLGMSRRNMYYLLPSPEADVPPSPYGGEP